MCSKDIPLVFPHGPCTCSMQHDAGSTTSGYPMKMLDRPRINHGGHDGLPLSSSRTAYTRRCEVKGSRRMTLPLSTASESSEEWLVEQPFQSMVGIVDGTHGAKSCVLPYATLRKAYNDDRHSYSLLISFSRSPLGCRVSRSISGTRRKRENTLHLAILCPIARASPVSDRMSSLLCLEEAGRCARRRPAR